MYVVAMGALENQDRIGLEAASQRAGARLVLVEDAQQLMREHVPEHGLPTCLFVARQEDHRSAIDGIREIGELFAVPVIALVEHPSESAFCGAMAAGANDVLVAGDTNGMVRRIVSLEGCASQARPPVRNGLAVVALGDAQRRRQLGRTLRQAGFEITFASAPEELQRVASGTVAPKLLVTTPSFAPHGVAGGARAVVASAGIETVVLNDARGARAGSNDTDTTGELLFRAEEALRGSVQERRASRRIHFATVCAFRKAGDLQPSFGLTHNLSAGGLYLRTLDVPAVGAVLWLELRLPYTNQTVHLRAEVVAATMPGSGTARPPGCGVKLLPMQCPSSDLSAFLSAYTELATRSPALQN